MQKHGFTLLEERELAETGGTARLWRHDGSGAQLLSIANSDENKCFGASFYTPPTDSTGVAHILEHSVLCGSRKFPVKEPFVELLKGSLQTFLNAFTFPDKTCYPVASANLRDFYNLVDVYLDAVFHPILSRDIFRQEGWHVETADAESPWTFKGVVYNEMKGVYSSPESILAEQSQQAVFPDNLYSLDSGGNPEHIPDLDYAAFCDFHKRYYQPGNARFFFWGDDPEYERLRIIAEAVAGATNPGEMPGISLQQPFAQPRYVEVPYAAAPGDDRALFTVNWLLGERGDVETAMKMEMLEHILEGLPGSPLRRALTESGLGEDTIGCGLETDLRQMYYSTGLRGVKPADVGVAEELILKTLGELAEGGIAAEAVAAAVNTVEFAYRENNSGRLPRGLAAMIQSLSTWLYGGDPLAPLAWEKPLANIKGAISRGEKIFEDMIRQWLPPDKNRVRVTLLPDEKLGETRIRSEKTRLANMREETSVAGRIEVARETERLRAAQLAADKPEDLAKIPALAVADLPLKNKAIPRQIHNIPQTFITHDLPTRGIAYVSLLLPIIRLPEKLAPLLPLFCRSLLDFGTAREDYSQLGMRMAGCLGGLGAVPLLGRTIDTGENYLYLTVSGKAVYDNIPKLYALIREILLEPQNNQEVMRQRLAQMALEDKARMEHGLQVAGNAAVGARLRAHFRGIEALAEKLSGISQLWYLRGLIDRMEKDADGVLSELEELRALIVGAAGAIIDCVAESSAFGQVESGAKALLTDLPAKPALSAGELIADLKPMHSLPAGEAFLTPGQVNYVGKGANLYDLGYAYKGSANVILRWLRMGRLWEEVRVAGGAYGVGCTLDRIGGNFVCASYRDPGVDPTLAAYDGLGVYLREFTPTKAQLSQAIVGAVGDMDAYLLPDARGAKSLGWYLAGLTPEARQQTREEMLATTAADFQAFADVMEAFAREGAVCVLGGPKTAEAAREHGWKEHRMLGAEA